MVKVRFNDQPIQVRVANAAIAAHQAQIAEAQAILAEAAKIAAELARDQAADLVLPENIFAAADLATATANGEAAVAAGTYFKAVGQAEGLAEVRIRTSGGSDLLYTEVTKARLNSTAGASEIGLGSGRTLQEISTADVGFSEGGAPPVQTNAEEALSALVRTGKTGIFTTEAEIPDHRAGVLTYRKMAGGQAELLTDLSRFYPEGAFIDPTPEAPTYAAFDVTTWNTTSTPDVHRFVIDPWDGPELSVNNARYAGKIVDTATGRVYPLEGYPGTDYTGAIVYNASSGRPEINVKMPSGVSPPASIVAYIPHYSGDAEKLYVDPISGNDLNDGRSWDWALATHTEAISRAPKAIFCKPGVYTLGNYPGTYTGGDISIRCIGGKAIFVPRPFTFSSWALHSGSTYVTTVGGSPTPVGAVDLGTLDEFGLPTVLEAAADLAECVATEGTFFYDAAGPRKMYVHLSGGKVPTSADVMPYSLGVLFRHSAPGSKVHIADMVFVNGSGGAVGARDAGIDAVLTIDRCAGIGSFNKNGLDILDIGLVISRHFIARGNANDGLNYTAFNGLSPHFIEIGCVGYGNKADGTGNGSTSHDDVRGFRINCDYALNAGPALADVGTAKTVNVNITARGSGPNANANGFRAAISATVILDGGAAFDNAGADFEATDDSVIKARDCFGRTQSGTIEAL